MYCKLRRKESNFQRRWVFCKTRIWVSLLMFLLLGQYPLLYAQSVTMTSGTTDLKNLFRQIEKQTGYTFFYKEAEIDKVGAIQVKFQNTPLVDVLKQTLNKHGLDYEIVGKTVTIKPSIQKNNPTAKVSTQNAVQRGHGKVTNEQGDPLEGVSLRVKENPDQVTITGSRGIFTLTPDAHGKVIVVSSVGYSTYEFKANLDQQQNIMLKSTHQQVEEVVATGMMEFKKSAFSGASSSFKQEELKRVANTNVIQAIRSLDPSFLVMENNLIGANPNALPTIELRGQTSISSDNLRDAFTDDPNQPLFILDGFQTNLRAILDLDMNRIHSITILKDASSTAIYGSRASNGVVVVETIKPKPGQVRLSYTTDLNLDVADLGSYNMMNAAEKLEFERLSGVYTAPTINPEGQHSYYNPLYNSRLESVLEGVDTYWIKEPIRNGFSQRHALYAEGGNEGFIYNIGGSYKKQNGVMKGSGREDWGGRINLTYLNNKLRINNNLTLQGYQSNESNYGSFATWVNTNPYYQKVDSSIPTLETYGGINSGRNEIIVYNPLYNAHLNNNNGSKNWGFVNNFQAIYKINNQWRVQSSLQLEKGSTTAIIFTSPLHTRFAETSPLLKGTYNSNTHDIFSYTANAMLSYATSIGKHAINANGRIEFSDITNTALGFTAVGFPLTSNGNPAFAYGYETGGSPNSQKSVKRRNSLIGTATYSYDNRYNADLSMNYDGSTAFGSQNSYSPFFSVGGSWNLHNESFLSGNSAFNRLRLRANYGITGNQNFSSSSSISTYNYLSAYNYTGQGVTLATFQNENLKWQKTKQLSAGIDAILLQNRLTIDLNVYHKKTENLAVAVDLPSSTGLMAYPFNAGDLTIKGAEITTRYNFIHRPEQRFTWNIGLTGAINSQTYDNFNNLLAGMNQSLQNSNSLRRFRDGYSPNDLWAVRSLGIDPSTGQELYLKKNGTQTFNYDTQDITVVGNNTPKMQGVLSTNLTYKGFTLSAYMRYIWDQDIMNTALFNKVENVSLNSVINNNQDKRALYERWRNPGDQTEFKSISLTTSTQISSRFVQQENTFSLESVSLAYDFRDALWLRSAGLSNLRVTALTNELARWSTVRRERGIDYPYARTFSLSVNANF